MKKIVSLIIAAATLVISLPYVYAAETEEYKKVLTTVKERLEIQDVYDSFDSNTSNYNGQTSYYFNWSTEGDSSVYLSVGCTSDGIITEYHYNDNSKIYSSERTFKKYENEQYRAAALNFIALLNPDIKDNIIISDTDRYSVWSKNTTFSLEYVHDGITVNNIQGSISIDSENMTLQSFSLYDYVNVKYPDKSTFIDKAAAIAAYNSQYGLELVYILEYEDDKITAVPYYQPNSDSNEYINAVTGEKYEYDYSITYANAKLEATADMSAGGATNSFSRIEQQEIDNVEGLVSVEELTKSLKGISVLDIPADAVTEYYHLSKSGITEEYTYDINLSSGEDSRYLSINAKTGEIKSYRRYFRSETEASLPEEELKEKSISYAKELAGDKLVHYADNQEFEGNSLTLYRTVNGARVEGDTIRVTVNKNNGKLTYYNISYTNADFPALDGIISTEAAAKSLFDNVDYEVKYIFVPLVNERPKEAVAVYSFDFSQSHRVNPFTGELEKNDMNEVAVEYNDINGHYAENQIKKLAQYNIGFKAESFKPDSDIKQKDLIMLLTQAFSSVSTYREADYEYIFDRAQNLNIISKDERNDEANVSRLQAAVFLIRALGAERYAKLDGIWSCPFGDVTEKVGYVCLLNGMGIINGDGNGCFNPDGFLTNADCAIMIYNALSR